MSASASYAFWWKTAQACALAIAVCFTLGAADTGSRYNSLNHRLMCTCGCAELLGECNHVGCQNSGQELAELRADLDRGMSDQEILDAFSAKYGATVLAAPPTQGFDLVAWITPFALFAAATLMTVLLVRRWSARKPAAIQAATGPDADAIREKIRRETGSDGGF